MGQSVRLFSRAVFLLAPIVALWGCSFSSTQGSLGRAEFRSQACGVPVELGSSCDLSRPLAQGGKVSVLAVPKDNDALLSLSSSAPGILQVEQGGDGTYTVTGIAPGQAELLAVAGQGTVLDRLTMSVAKIDKFAYSMLSDASGSFLLTPQGEADGVFSVKAGLPTFSLVLGMLDGEARQIMGRESFTPPTLPAGLRLAAGKEHPGVLHFEFERPQKGDYPFRLRAAAGGAEVLFTISVKE